MPDIFLIGRIFPPGWPESFAKSWQQCLSIMCWFGFSAGTGGRGRIFFFSGVEFFAGLAGKFCQELATLPEYHVWFQVPEVEAEFFFSQGPNFSAGLAGKFCQALATLQNHVWFLCQVPEVGADFFFSGRIFPPDRPESFAKRWQHCFMFGLVLSGRYRRTDEERVRCFLVKETKRGIQVAQSSSPSCHTDLHSSLAAHRTFKAQSHKILLRLEI